MADSDSKIVISAVVLTSSAALIFAISSEVKDAGVVDDGEVEVEAEFEDEIEEVADVVDEGKARLEEEVEGEIGAEGGVVEDVEVRLETEDAVEVEVVDGGGFAGDSYFM